MPPESIINSVRTFLSSHHMYAVDEWIEGCVEYLTEDSSRSFSDREIHNLAKEQWLLNNLKDICPGSLPANLKNQRKTVLNGRYVLQINAAIDIGTPAYQQYLKLQKINTENVEATTRFDDKIPSHRMIKLYLTDGEVEITGIEYKPMRNLSCDITPGCKVLIKGLVDCRRGVLLLTESNVELLGGEVDDLAVSNSLAGLLSAKLGVPITQEPTNLNTTVHQPRNTDIPAPHTQMPSSQTDIHTDRPIARVTSVQLSTFNDDDIDIDIDQIAAIEAQFDNPGKRPLADTHNKPEKKLKTDQRSSDVKCTTDNASNFTSTIENRTNTITNSNSDLKPNTIDDYPTDNDLFFEDEDYAREMEANFDRQIQYPTKLSSEPFVYIKQINEMQDSDKIGRVFRVKGQIMKLLSKLSVSKDGWSLKCTIVDGTGGLDVEFTSEVLSKLVGFSPQEMNQLKKEMAKKPELKGKAVSALQKAKDTLQVMYCIVELTILEVPKITCLIPFDETHLNLLRRRHPNYL